MRTSQVATSALVLMARGINQNWKQAISFYFVNNICPSDRLKIILKETIAQLEEIGFNV